MNETKKRKKAEFIEEALENTDITDPENLDDLELEENIEFEDPELPEFPTDLPVLPLKNIVMLPTSIVPVIVGRKSSIKAVEDALNTFNKTIFITSQKNPDTENPGFDDIFAHGVLAIILQVMKMPNGSLKILVEGLDRAYIQSMAQTTPYLLAHVQSVQIDHEKSTVEAEAAWRQLETVYADYTKLNSKMPANLTSLARTLDDKDAVTDTIAVQANFTFNERQELLEMADVEKRILRVAMLLAKEIEILKAEQRIKGLVQDQVEKNQREYYLTEQIKAIHKELGRDDQIEEVAKLREKIKPLQLPKDAAEKAEKELKRLEQMPPMSAEGAVSKNYLDWIISLPWHKVSKDNISLAQAEKILNKHHEGLTKAKERIIEFIAAKKFAQGLKRSPIICLAGPPGVGKTSLASSIAESLGREFVRISLGGVKDEAEIRGHRRTYIGAMPGKIIQAMRKAKTINPVILLDEIDKMAKDAHADPAAAMLEVLDPEQNCTFNDHYLDIEYDLSQVMFIATANVVDAIPYALYDRMEMIYLSGYTEAEKRAIAKNFLIPKHLKEHGLEKKQFKISDEVLSSIITEYTKEAGVRHLERIITKLMRKTIQELLKDETIKTVSVTAKKLHDWLGFATHKKTELSSDEKKIGLVTGLAWTELGGDVLEIEISLLPGKGGLTLTGQLGEVMQESAQAAYSYVKSNAERLHIPKSVFNNKDIHIHIPEGATPKDGPSAGITMCTALVSALKNIPVANDVAMTGEVTLRGRVLAIGGLKEKLLAAQQYHKTRIIVPKINENDVKEIEKEISGLTIIYADHMDTVLQHALTKNPFEKKEIKPKAKRVRMTTQAQEQAAKKEQRKKAVKKSVNKKTRK